MRKFHGTKVLGLFGMGANVPWNESSTGAKVLSMVFSLPGTKVQSNEKASYHSLKLNISQTATVTI